MRWQGRLGAMQRRLMIVVVVVLAVVGGIAGLVLASQQGWFGGRAKWLLSSGMHAQQRGQFAEAAARFEELLATFPDSPLTDDALFQLGRAEEAQRHWAEARAAYETVLERFPDSPLLAQTQTALGEVNIALLYSPETTALQTTYQVKPGDTLGQIASATHTTTEFIKKANGLAGDVIHPGQRFNVPKGRFSVVVDKSQNQLLLTLENRFLKLYTVATGKENSTPVGTFKVVTKLQNPVWYKQGAVVPADSPENILGTRWMGWDKAGYGIHGSVDPNAMGQQVTAGCVRMTNPEVEELFALIPVGTDVTIVD